MSESRKIKICETGLRDAHQSLIATRMTTEEMLPVLEAMDKVGYYSLEAWGGATFDACLRFLNEDPWKRLRMIRDQVKNTKLQMLFRGQNILGYRHYADDVVEYFVQKSIANGIDIIRIFDALNDPRNLKTAISAAKREGGHVQAAVSYTTSPVHTSEAFAEYARQVADMGADSICIKDMAGLLGPYQAESLVRAIKEKTDLPVELHTHYTAGLASMTLLKAVEAGADIIDTAISPLALGTSQPPTESMVAALAGSDYDTGISLEALEPVRAHFAGLRDKYIKNGQLDPTVLRVDVNALRYQVPGGMLSNLVSQLKSAGRSELLEAVLEEVPRVRRDAGYPPLVTPTSQIVGTQAVFNVLSGERYKMVSKEFTGIIAGEYGKTPAPIDPEFSRKILGEREPITCRPADLLEPELERLKDEIKPYIEQEEDVLSYALFGAVAVDFFKRRQEKKYHVDDKADKKHFVHTV